MHREQVDGACAECLQPQLSPPAGETGERCQSLPSDINEKQAVL